MNSDYNSSSYEFRNAIIEAGFQSVPRPIEPGKIHRFPGINKKRGKTDGWCLLFDDCRGGVYGDWSTGLTATWQAGHLNELTPAEKARFKREIKEAQRQRDKEQREAHKKGALKAQNLIRAASLEFGTHRYLQTKQVQPYGIYTNGYQLVIPAYDINGNIQSLQHITPTGDKKFMGGGKAKGGMYFIGEIKAEETILICEGFATGATLHEESGHPVVVAFNADNLEPVSLAIRKKYPKAELIICGDNDRTTEGNPGKTKATKAALTVGAQLAIPEFSETESGSDWNDWHNNRRGAAT